LLIIEKKGRAIGGVGWLSVDGCKQGVCGVLDPLSFGGYWWVLE